MEFRERVFYGFLPTNVSSFNRLKKENIIMNTMQYWTWDTLSGEFETSSLKLTKEEVKFKAPEKDWSLCYLVNPENEFLDELRKVDLN